MMDLLNQMACVMFYDDVWRARAQGCQQYAEGATPEAAMQAALDLLNQLNSDLF